MLSRRISRRMKTTKKFEIVKISKKSRKNFLYVVRMPGDSHDQLDWFEAFATRSDAVDAANERAEWLTFDTGSQWDVKFVPYGSSTSWLDYQGENSIVIEQATSIYHGA